MARALVNIPRKAKRGELIEIKALISHPMETGYRHDETGKAVPRDILNRFVCTYNGVEIFRADLFPAVSANPFLSFSTVATETGVITLSWTGDDGEIHTQMANITVE